MLPERLIQLRMRHKKTQQELADYLGVTRQAYGYYEAGKRDVDTATLGKLADYYDVCVDYLLGRDKKEKSGMVAAEQETDFIKKARDIATERGMELTDPKFLGLLDVALDFARRISEDQGK